MGYERERKNAAMNINQGKGFMCPVCGAFITPVLIIVQSVGQCQSTMVQETIHMIHIRPYL